MDSRKDVADSSKEMARPLFSVITPTINRGTLDRTIDSLLGQGIQHIVVGDGVEPQYTSPSEIVSISTPHNLKNFGHSPRMYAWFYTNGEYIGYIDDDDYYMFGAFETLKKQIADNPGYEFYFFPAIRLGQVFYYSPPGYGRTVSCQYVHRKYDHQGQPIIFGDGVQDKGHGCDGFWIDQCIKKYSYKMLDCLPLVNVTQIGNGK